MQERCRNGAKRCKETALSRSRQQELNKSTTGIQHEHNRGATKTQQQLSLTQGSHGRHAALTLFAVEDAFPASGAIVSGDGWDDRGFVLVGAGQVAGVMDQVCSATAGAFHGHCSLKD